MATPPDAELHKGLKQRHLTMIAIGGVIGAGLFVGSGAVIQDVGPAAFLTYAVTGVLIVMVMRMLGEMSACEARRTGHQYFHRVSAFAPFNPAELRRDFTSRS